jgi:hypothetical protein
MQLHTHGISQTLTYMSPAGFDPTAPAVPAAKKALSLEREVVSVIGI